MGNKTKKQLTKIEVRFDVFFEYDNKELEINVYRLDWSKTKKSDILSSIFLDDYLTKSQFEDECVCWCDTHAA